MYKPPPEVVALQSVMVQFFIVSTPAETTYIPPPMPLFSSVALFPLIVQPERFAEPLVAMYKPPPLSVALQPVRVQFFIVNTPAELTNIPPPKSVLPPPLSTRSSRTTVPPAYIMRPFPSACMTAFVSPFGLRDLMVICFPNGMEMAVGSLVVNLLSFTVPST